VIQSGRDVSPVLFSGDGALEPGRAAATYVCSGNSHYVQAAAKARVSIRHVNGALLGLRDARSKPGDWRPGRTHRAAQGNSPKWCRLDAKAL